MQERLNPSDLGKGHVYLGRDMLKANVGMKVLRQGEESYFALLDAGVNWYESDYTMEFYMLSGNEITLQITPLIGKSSREARIIFDDFPGNIARIRARFYLEAENLLIMEARDLGFGEFRHPSQHVWKEKIELY